MTVDAIDRPEPPVPTPTHRPSIRKRLFSYSSNKKGPRTWEKTEKTGDVGGGSLSEVSKGQDPSSSSSVVPSPEEADSREQASLNTTLSGNQHHLRVPFYRRKGNKSTASDIGALSSTTSHSKSSISNQKVKASRRNTRPGGRRSLLSRVVKLVPCVGSEEHVVAPIKTDNDVVDEVMTEVKQPPPNNTDASINLASPALVVPNTASNSSSQPPSPTDSDIIIPPPPSTQLLPEDETDGLTSGAVQPPGSTGEPLVRSSSQESDDESDGTHFTEEDDMQRNMHMLLDEQAEEERLINNGGNGIPIGPDGIPQPLLPPVSPAHAGRKCLVLDLDETLVHSSFKPIPGPDFIVPVEIESHWHHFHVLKRPGVDLFLKEMGEHYEIVVFTASLSKYADPVLDQLDISKVVAHRLFRESCYSHKGNYVKDLSQLGRPIADTIILDNSPASYIFHPTNAVPVSSWFNDPHDAELTDLIPFLVDLADMGRVMDVRNILDSAR